MQSSKIAELLSLETLVFLLRKAKHHQKVAFDHGAIHCYRVVLEKRLHFKVDLES
jgi:hypothetical protein